MDAISSPPPHSISLGGFRTPAPRCARHHLHGAGIRNPSQQRPIKNNWFGGDQRVFAASYALAVERRGGRSAEDPPCSYAPSAMAIHDLGIRDYSSGRKSVWSIRVRLEIARTWRDLALFNLARDSKLRACDLVKLRVDEVCSGAKIRNRATIEERQANRCNSRLRSRRRPPSKFGYGCSGQLALDISSQADFMHAHTYRPGNTPG
jgi:hypothetical protein